MFWTKLDRYADVGLLIIRVGIGLSFIFLHGAGKLFGGPERWEQVGRSARFLGLDFWPVFWGFVAAMAEFGGGFLLILGLFFRPALVLLLPVMITAVTMHLTTGRGSPDEALEMAVLFTGLFFTGPGRYSLDAWLSDRSAPRRPHRGI